MRILILADIHANIVALDAVLADAGDVAEIWNLGDTVGYGPRPRECIDRVQAVRCAPVLAGNHDLAAIGKIDLSSFNPAAREAATWTGNQLHKADRAFLESLPSLLLYGDVTLAHGSPRSPVWEYVATDVEATENFRHFQTPVCFVGHTHVASFAELEDDETRSQLYLLADGDSLDLGAGRWLINPGSVGQPRDRDPRAAYAVLDTERATLTAHRADYDIAATQAQMTIAGLPESLIRRLALGL